MKIITSAFVSMAPLQFLYCVLCNMGQFQCWPWKAHSLHCYETWTSRSRDIDTSLFFFFQNNSKGTVKHKGRWLASPQSNMPPLSLHIARWGAWYHYTPTQWKLGEKHPSHSPSVCCMLIVPSDIHLHDGTAKKRLPRMILLKTWLLFMCLW